MKKVVVMYDQKPTQSHEELYEAILLRCYAMGHFYAHTYALQARVARFILVKKEKKLLLSSLNYFYKHFSGFSQYFSTCVCSRGPLFAVQINPLQIYSLVS